MKAAQLALDAKFDFGDRVFLVVGESDSGVVTALQLNPGVIHYEVMWAADKKTWHDASELSTQRHIEGVEA